MLDVGAGGGEIDAYFQKKYCVNITAIDVAPPEKNRWAKGDQGTGILGFPIHVFDGKWLNYENGSYDIVLFNMVLHHAAKTAPQLLQEAVRVSKMWVVLLEDVSLMDTSSS